MLELCWLSLIGELHFILLLKIAVQQNQNVNKFTCVGTYLVTLLHRLKVIKYSIAIVYYFHLWISPADDSNAPYGIQTTAQIRKRSLH